MLAGNAQMNHEPASLGSERATPRPVDDADPMDLAAFVGPNWDDYYRRHFGNLAAGRSGGFNLWACIFLVFWFLYRRMYLTAALLAGLLWGMDHLRQQVALGPWLGNLTDVVTCVAVMAPVGMLSNAWYFHHARRAIAAARNRGLTGADLTSELMRRGGTRLWTVLLWLLVFSVVNMR